MTVTGVARGAIPWALAAGATAVITRGGPAESTVSGVALPPVPTGVVTASTPDVAFAGTVNVRVVAVTTVKFETAAPFKVSVVAPVKLVPVTVTEAPGSALLGEKLVMVGAVGMRVNTVGLVAGPTAVVTLTVPVWAPAGTVMPVIWVPVALTTKPVLTVLPLVPPNVTRLVPVRLVPFRVRLVPTDPLLGLMLVTIAVAATGTKRYVLPSAGSV